MSQTMRIGIIPSSTRAGRFADKPAQWLLELATKREDVAFEIVDLRDYPLPFFDETMSPLRSPAKNEVAQRFASKLGELDGFVFVTGEYNHGIPAVLKNALDHVYAELNRKPAAFVAYGGTGGARAVEQLRANLLELQVAPLRNAVHIARDQFMGMVLQGKTFADFPELETNAATMLDELLWWTTTLRAGRRA